METVRVLGLCQTLLWSPSCPDLRNMSQARLFSCQHRHFTSHRWLKGATWQPQLFAAKALLLRQNPKTPAGLFYKQLILDLLLSESLSNLGALGNTPSQAGGWDLLLCLSKETVVTCVWETSLPWEWPKYIIYMKYGVYKHSILSYVKLSRTGQETSF